MGHSPPILPLAPRPPVPPPVTAPLAHWTISLPLDLETSQRRWNRGSGGWQIWRHTDGRCLDLIRESFGGLVRGWMHVFHPWGVVDE